MSIQESAQAVEHKEMALPEGFHDRSKIKQVAIKELKVDRSYQREPSMRLADDIAGNWDEVASELILVSDRGERPEENEVEGGLFVVNGQHRTLGARKLGMTKIWARIVDLSDLEDPAQIEAGFRLKTNVRLGDRPLERFKAQVRSGDEQSIAIVRLLNRYGTYINETPTSDEGINSVATVETLYSLDDGGILAETLEVIRDGLQHLGGKNTNANMLKGVAWLLLQHSDKADRFRIVEKVKYGVPAIDQRARAHRSVMGGTEWMNYYRALVDFYNEKLRERSKLDWQTRGATRWDTSARERRLHSSWAGRDSN